MRRRFRLLRIAKWSGLVACVVLLLAWGMSLRWHIGYVARSHAYAWTLEDGKVRCVYVPPPAAVGSSGEYGFYVGSARPHEWGFILPSIRTIRMGRGSVVQTYTQIPVWLPLAINALLTVFLFWRDRPILPGHCPCGYDLRGNVSGVCPECGVEMS